MRTIWLKPKELEELRNEVINKNLGYSNDFNLIGEIIYEIIKRNDFKLEKEVK